MSPDELTAAALKIREIAAKALPGPWEDTQGRGRRIIYSPVDEVTEDHTVADGAWIALVSPSIAEPLALWLEQHADEHSTYGRDRPDCAALNLARLINTTVPQP